MQEKSNTAVSLRCLDAEYDGVDDAVLPAITHRKAGLGREGQLPHEGEQTHLAGSGVLA